MTKTISLICAKPHFNPGMYSVDYAFEFFLKRNSLNIQFERYNFGANHKAKGLGAHPLHYRSLERNFEEAISADLLLYWGDFHHAFIYWENALLGRTKKRHKIQHDSEAIGYIAKHLCLHKQRDSVLRKALSFGSTTLGDDFLSTTSRESAYKDAYPEFIKRARKLWFRDPVSAMRASAIRGASKGSCLGVDCAHMMSRQEYQSLSLPAPAVQMDYACIHFGRTPQPTKPMLEFAKSLSDGAGLQATWLPWLKSKKEVAQDVRQVIPGILWDIEDLQYQQVLARLLGARLAITDTYHMALIAWRLGIPTICIGQGGQRAVRAVSDKKKELFYLTHDITPCYIFYEELLDESRHNAIVSDLLPTIFDESLINHMGSLLAHRAETAELELKAEIKKILGFRLFS